MKWLVGLIGLVMAIGGGMQLGATSSNTTTQASFSYDEATAEEREAWMHEIAAKLEKHGKREASSSQFVSYKETKVRVKAREVQTILKLGHYANFRLDSKTLSDTLTKVCPYYVKQGLYANNIKWTQKIVKRDGSVALNLPITRTNCKRYVNS